MYRPPEDIQELRAKGIPWVIAAAILIILVVVAAVVYTYFDPIKDSLSHRIKSNIEDDIDIEPELIEEEVAIIVGEGSGAEVSLKLVSTTVLPVRTSADAPSIIPRLTTQPTVQEIPKTPIVEWPKPHSTSRYFRKGAVSSENELCAEIGRNVLLRGGNAVDAAIATQICMGAVHPHQTGLGGGMIMIIYDSKREETMTINAQETAPISVTEKTYAANPKLAQTGYSSVGTPGVVCGLWTAYKRFGSGRIAWQDLLMATVQLIHQGFPVSSSLVEAIRSKSKEITSEKSLNLLFNSSLQEGDIMRDMQLADVIRRLAISRDPYKLFYKEDIADQLIREMKNKGGLLTKADLVNYDCRVEEPLSSSLSSKYSIIGPTPPSSFSALQLAVGIIMHKYKHETNLMNDAIFHLDVVKAAQLAESYWLRTGDPQFDTESRTLSLNMTSEGYFRDLAEDLNNYKIDSIRAQQKSHVGTHINVIDGDGNVVSLSSSLGEIFGSLRRSEHMGSMWNNGMTSFSLDDNEETEKGEVNGVEGRKKARIRMTPAIVFQKDGNKPFLSIGVSGSSQLTSTVVQFLLRKLLLDKDLTSSVDTPRMYINESNGKVSAEFGFPKAMLSQLSDISTQGDLTGGIVHVLERSSSGHIQSVCDHRGHTQSCTRGF